MMVMPSKKEREMKEKIKPWLLFKADGELFYLDDKAPDKIKKIYSQYREEYVTSGHWLPVE